MLLPVQFGLYARPGTALADVRLVHTHPHAAAQCRRWLADHLPEAEVVVGGSTAAAAAEVARPGSPLRRRDLRAWSRASSTGSTRWPPGSPTTPTRSPASCWSPGPGRSGSRPARTRRRWCSSCARTTPARCCEILEQFASRGVDLCRIESRPTRRTLGDYCFSVDAEGHVTDARLAEAMMGLYRTCAEVVFLGSYPRADRTAVPDVRPGTANADYDAASSWLERLKG